MFLHWNCCKKCASRSKWNAYADDFHFPLCQYVHESHNIHYARNFCAIYVWKVGWGNFCCSIADLVSSGLPSPPPYKDTASSSTAKSTLSCWCHSSCCDKHRHSELEETLHWKTAMIYFSKEWQLCLQSAVNLQNFKASYNINCFTTINFRHSFIM